MNTVRIERIEHQGETRIGITLPWNHEKTDQIRAIAGRRWSATRKCWHIPYTRENIELLKNIFPELVKNKVVKADTSSIPSTPAPGRLQAESPTQRDATTTDTCPIGEAKTSAPEVKEVCVETVNNKSSLPPVELTIKKRYVVIKPAGFSQSCTSCVITLPLACSKAAPTYGLYKHYWDTQMCELL